MVIFLIYQHYKINFLYKPTKKRTTNPQNLVCAKINSAENELSDIFVYIDGSDVTDSEMDDAGAPLQVAGEKTTIRCCVDQTYATGCGIVNHVAIQAATDVGLKAAATDDQRDIDKVHPQIVVLNH